REGQICIRDFDDDELAAAGVPQSALRNPHYVKSRGAMADVAGFDAALFQMSPREAAFTDPQQRHFLECAFAALEDAGHDPGRSAERTGVFGGVSASYYFANNVVAATGYDALCDPEQLDRLRYGHIGSSKDFLATRVSYRLDLRGPSVAVQTACSSSLVAVHMAIQSLLGHECDLALAGGASIFVPNRSGYLYQPGGVVSPDGRCRPFDAAAAGTVPGNGVGVVILRRLADAIADGDAIRAVIRGSAINTDGALKVGFGAPGISGQAEVIREALAVADVSPDTISYVETHGTGTAIGDPVELTALGQVLGKPGKDAVPCALGAIKATIGHLDAAAGVAGLIKTTLMLERGQLLPQPSFERLNPRIELSDRLSINTALGPWTRGAVPRRAGVSSFGIGGTNAHVVLEEAPLPAQRASSSPRPAPAIVTRPEMPEADGTDHPLPQVLLLSAHTEDALAARARDLADVLELGEDRAPPLPAVAHTLDVGRRPLTARHAVVAASPAAAARALRALADGHTDPTGVLHRGPVVFGLPGQGTQHIAMARGLYHTHDGFRDDFDRAGCASAVAASRSRASALVGSQRNRSSRRSLSMIPDR
ncbi:MAG: beta-ketoacyl synthase N-terminal-like domain-containing protein, partial [Myxococcota bacterium]